MTSSHYQLVSHQLPKLSWDWNHPRIVAYIQDLSSRHKTKYTHENLPANHYARLMSILRVYERINQMIIDLNGSWKAPFIVRFFQQNSTKDDAGRITNRLKLEQWMELEQQVIDVYCPF